MSGVATAITAAAVIGYAGSQKAANTQAGATNQANQTQWNMYNQNQQNLQPFMQYGQAAGSNLGYLLGLPGYQTMLNGNAQGGALGGYGSLLTPLGQNWQQDPGYAFRLQQGQQALERSAAAKGMTLSGAQQKALTAYGQGMGSQEYQAAFNRDLTQKQSLYNMLSGAQNVGLSGANALAGVGTNTANQISSNLMNLGAGQSAAQLSGTNALQGGLNQWANMTNWNNAQANNPWTQNYYQIDPMTGQFIKR